jgi:hypothetical protein
VGCPYIGIGDYFINDVDYVVNVLVYLHVVVYMCKPNTCLN